MNEAKQTGQWVFAKLKKASRLPDRGLTAMCKPCVGHPKGAGSKAPGDNRGGDRGPGIGAGPQSPESQGVRTSKGAADQSRLRRLANEACAGDSAQISVTYPRT